MADRPLKRSYSTMAEPSEDSPGGGGSTNDTTGSDGAHQGASAGTDSMTDASPDRDPQNGMNNSYAAPDTSFDRFGGEEDLESYTSGTDYITEQMLAHGPTSTPSRLLGLPAELLSEIAIRLDKKSMSALRLANKELAEATSREFRLLLHHQRVEFAPEGFRKLLDISQSRYAKEVKSIEFWAFNFNEQVYDSLWHAIGPDTHTARLLAGSWESRVTGLRHIDRDYEDDVRMKRIKRRFRANCRAEFHCILAETSTQLQDSLRASLSGLPVARSVSLRVGYSTEDDPSEAVADCNYSPPLSFWQFDALMEALAGRGMATDRLTLHDNCLINSPEDWDFTPPRSLNVLQVLPSLNELELVFREDYENAFSFRRVAEIISQAPNIRILRLTNVWPGNLYMRPCVTPLLARYMRLRRLQRLDLTDLTVCFSSLQMILAGHRSLVELNIRECEFHSVDAWWEVWMMVGMFLDARNVSISDNIIVAI
ncbi:hypothetical protein UCRNP2_1288 [Neofusicoccum parvum UCRNP2]|uniref:F-box domain-containing protein n=1 Tax=Botryosphaeria parva (strain UCR-NP2) TaxID=1287680 RepID=R1EVZ1_BOTPV|nr:hypothetical protein UCRNP2_1288 [Neofusicoccum parvum UCRNP2]